MKRILLIANWKMNPVSQREVERLFDNIDKGIRNIKSLKDGAIEIVICPPLVYLGSTCLPTRQGIKSLKSRIKFGGQNCHWEEKGSYTGEISARMLRDLGCKYVIVGHSERRKYFNETNEMINKKLLAAFRAGLKPILCVGEEKGEDMALTVKSQLVEGLKRINRAQMRDLIIAYEPVWAIGTGNPCQTSNALEVTIYIRKILTELYNRKLAEEIPVLYGGSINSKTAKDYLKIGMDGLLVGGASLDSAEFVRIIREINSE